MARKNEKPILTHTETLCWALKGIDAEINQWKVRCEGLPEGHFEKCTETLMEKREALFKLYLIETGSEYC